MLLSSAPRDGAGTRSRDGRATWIERDARSLDAVEILPEFVTAVGRAFVYIHFYSDDIAVEEVGWRVSSW